MIHGSKDSDVFTFEGYHTYERAHAVDLANPTVSDGKFKAMLWVHKANHNQFNSVWASGDPTGCGDAARQPGADRQSPSRRLGARPCSLTGREYSRRLAGSRRRTAWDPAGTELVSQYQDPERVFVQHNQEGLVPRSSRCRFKVPSRPTASSPARQLTALVGGAPTTTITLRLAWSALGSRLLLRWIPRRFPRNGTR